MQDTPPPPTPVSEKPDRPVALNLIVLVVVTASILAMPVRKAWLEKNDPHRQAEIRGRTIAQAFANGGPLKVATSSEALRKVDPTLEMATLPGIPRPNGEPVLAWRVIELPADAPRDVPILISSNVRADSLAALTGRVSDVLTDLPPFGTNSAVLVYRDGRATTVQGASLQDTWKPFLGDPLPAYRILPE